MRVRFLSELGDNFTLDKALCLCYNTLALESVHIAE